MNDNNNGYTEHYMLAFREAMELISQSASPLETEYIELKCCSGRILAKEIISPTSTPPFNNSAMDGYAVNYKELANATRESPVDLNLAGLTAAGDEKTTLDEIKVNSAWKIMTGAPVPDGFDSIIPIEDTELIQRENRVLCFSPPQKGAHIRKIGEDISKGDRVIASHSLINSNRLMALSSLGIEKVNVYKKPTIAVFSTGKELVDDPSIELKPGQIRNSNMPYIIDFLDKLPVNAYNAGTNYDDVSAYQKALQCELDKNTDIIISTGAVSMGDFDFIPQTIIKMGGKIIFHKCKIRPGKPILFAKFPNGSYYFGLPGNPISANIGLRFFTCHLIRLMFELPEEKPVKATLVKNHSKKKGLTNILKGRATITPKAQLSAQLLNGQESFKIQPLIDANGWIVLYEDIEEAIVNDLVDFYYSDLIFD